MPFSFSSCVGGVVFHFFLFYIFYFLSCSATGADLIVVWFAAYSCHGRWFDTEGTQFVIATPLATRRKAWSNDNNRPQPFRNSRRLCFMYRESGGVVSLTASPVACQRGVPPPPPMLAFNATSIGENLTPRSTPIANVISIDTDRRPGTPGYFPELRKPQGYH